MKLSRRLIPDIATLQAFECAARHSSFTRAAQELHLTQSAVSRQIKDLETQMGFLLFERVRQRIVLSQAGQKFLPEVRRLLSMTEDTMLRAMASGEAAQSFSLSTLPTFGARWLIPRLPNFLQKYPDVSVNIASRSRPFDFEDQPFDLAIHYGRPVWAHAHCHFLCSEIVVPVASPALIKMHSIQDVVDLLDVPLLHLATRPRLWSDWFDSHGLETEDAYKGHRVDQLSLIISAAIGGLGFALVPLYLIENELQSGQLRIVLDKKLKTENAYFVAVPEQKAENALTLNFRSWIAEEIAKDPALAETEI